MSDLRSRDGLAAIVDAQLKRISQLETDVVVLEDALRDAGKAKPRGVLALLSYEAPSIQRRTVFRQLWGEHRTRREMASREGVGHASEARRALGAVMETRNSGVPSHAESDFTRSHCRQPGNPGFDVAVI